MLYIVGTPIGNIEDMSLRGVKTLVKCDIIYAEDTRSFSTFYKRVQDVFGLKAKDAQRVVSLHKENEYVMIPEVVHSLHKGLEVALVSEAGMPGISDPGMQIIDRVRKEGFPSTVIPGPTAFTTAAVMSGIPYSRLLFLGFLPKKESQVRKQLVDLAQQLDDETLVAFYEAPHRIKETLQVIQEVLKPAKLLICRELTKKFEEVIEVTSSDDIEDFRGELVVLFKI